MFHFGITRSGCGRSVGSPRKCVQLDTRVRAWFRPVISSTRVGVQTALEYAFVNFIPSSASRSMLGVR